MPLFPLSENKQILLRPVLFGVTALEGFCVFYRLIQVPRSPGGGLAASISILLMVLAALLTLAPLAASYTLWRWPQKSIFDLSDAQHSRRLTALSLLALAAIPLIIIISACLHSLYLGTDNALYRLTFLHLDPFLLWAGLTAVQLWGWLFATRPDKLTSLWADNHKLCKTALLAWSIFLLLALVVRLSGLRVPETSMTAWAIPAVPLLEWHIWLSGLVAALFFVLDKPEKQPDTPTKPRLKTLLRSEPLLVLPHLGAQPDPVDCPALVAQPLCNCRTTAKF